MSVELLVLRAQLVKPVLDLTVPRVSLVLLELLVLVFLVSLVAKVLKVIKVFRDRVVFRVSKVLLDPKENPVLRVVPKVNRVLLVLLD